VPEQFRPVFVESTAFYRVYVLLSKVSGLRKTATFENLPKVSSLNRRNSRFRGDYWRRPVRSPPSGRPAASLVVVIHRMHHVALRSPHIQKAQP
jgi:hypothetical protein